MFTLNTDTATTTAAIFTFERLLITFTIMEIKTDQNITFIFFFYFIKHFIIEKISRQT